MEDQSIAEGLFKDICWGRQCSLEGAAGGYVVVVAAYRGGADAGVTWYRGGAYAEVAEHI